MKPAWKRLSSGAYIDLNNFNEEDVNIDDIETSLNMTYRFNGHGKEADPLTVAQHSYLCLQLAKMMYPEDWELHRKVFIHDFAEAYIGDIASPVKKALGKAWYDFADPIEDVVNSRFLSTPVTAEDKQKIKLCDLTSLDIERRCMWKSQLGKNKWPTGHANFGNMQDKFDLFNEAKAQKWVVLSEYL